MKPSCTRYSDGRKKRPEDPVGQTVEDELRYILSLDSDIGTRAELVERYEEVYSYRMTGASHREMVRYCVLFVLPS